MKRQILLMVIVCISMNSFMFSTAETLHGESMQDPIENKLIQTMSWLENHKGASLVVAGLASFALGMAFLYHANSTISNAKIAVY